MLGDILFHPVHLIITMDELGLVELSEVIHGVGEAMEDEFAFGGRHSPRGLYFVVELACIYFIEGSFEIAASLGE